MPTDTKKMGILQSVIQYLETTTDEEDNRRPQSPLFPRANHSISSPSSCYYYLNTGETLEYARRNNIAASTHQWQKGKGSVVGSTFPGGKGEEKGRLRDRMMIRYTVEPPQGRWIKHYSSYHRILLVGEGDFSFSTCLAATFGLASNMIATSLDSEGISHMVLFCLSVFLMRLMKGLSDIFSAFLVNNYQNALSNIVELSIRKCKVMHEVDATNMAKHEFLGGIKFDRIIFNFPYAGFFKTLSRDARLGLHRTLVSLFMKNAKEMLSENGEIHITHKTNGFHREWNLESIASCHQLRLIESVQFCKDEYPGYNTKYGFGGDNNFDCNPAKTYKFGLIGRVSY